MFFIFYSLSKTFFIPYFLLLYAYFTTFVIEKIEKWRNSVQG